ncbi:MAG: hypothetical protein C0599_05200 [Salinivirgaceae bacterium]|nr:MAG: hypothetical protein C0599_05200 [Salinivirgaceae bacterium]
MGNIYNANAQTGIFYYSNPSENFINNRVVALTEAPNQELYLLGKLSNSSYEKSVPFFCRVDKRGNLLVDKAVENVPVYDLNHLFILNNQRVKIFGSKRQGPIFAPWIATLGSQGNIEKQKSDYVVYSTIMNDVTGFGQDHVVLAETRVDNKNIYNINLIKFNASSDATVWSSQLKSGNNEEASKIINLKDGNLLVLGKKYNYDLSDFSPVLYKVDANGKSMWKVPVKVPENFYAQDVKEDSEGNLIYMCSYSKEYMGTNETRIIKLDKNGSKISYNVILDISGNGVVLKEDDQIILFGSNIKVINERPVTKGKYVLISKDLKQLHAKEFSIKDKPDSEMPQDVASNLPTISDITTGILLKDGRVALAGRIYMPADPKNANPYGTDRKNFALLVLLNSSGRL